MRNLKKILALVLAVMMVLSVMVTASAAFVDEDKITNKEAVTVMSELGILTGKGDAVGFDPEGILNRAEAAVMLTKAMLGAYWATELEATVDALTNPFTDVADSHWGVDYIMFAYDQGLIIGDGKGHFDPKAELTGYAFGKMLLIATGAVEAEKFTATGWMKTVAENLAKLGWADDLDITLSKPLNREDAAEMLFEAMQYYAAEEYGYPVYKTVNNAPVYYGFYDTLVEAAYAVTVLNGATQDNPFTYGIEKVAYGSECLLDGWYVVAGATADAYGRPLVANWYSYLHNAYIYTEMATPVAEYTTTTTTGAIYTKLGMTATKLAASSFTYLENGKSETAPVLAPAGYATVGAPGTLTQVFYLGKVAGVAQYRITSVDTYVGYVADWTDYTFNAAGQVTNYPYITINDYADQTVGSIYTAYCGDAYSEADEPIANVKGGTTVLYQLAWDATTSTYYVNYAENAELAQVTTTAATSKNGNVVSFVAGGKTYAIADNFVGAIAYSAVPNANNDYYVAYDFYGNVILASSVSTIYSYGIGVVVDAAVTSDVWASGNNAYQLKILTPAGEVITVATDADSYGLVVNNGALVNTLVYYKINEKGQYVFTSQTSIALTGMSASFDLNAGIAQVENGSEDFVANAKTVFYVGTTNANTGAITWKTYTGIANVPSYEYKDANSKLAVLATNGVANAVVILDAQLSNSAVTAKDVAYVVYNANADTIYDATGTYKVYTAHVNGAITSIKVNASNVASVFPAGQSALVTSLVSEKGLVVSSDATWVAPLSTVSGTVAAKILNGVVYIGGAAYSVADDCAFYAENGIGGLVATTAASLIKAGYTTNVTALLVNGVVTTVYITYSV